MKDHFACQVAIADEVPRLNDAAPIRLPPLRIVRGAIDRLVPLDWLIAEGPAAFLCGGPPPLRVRRRRNDPALSEPATMAGRRRRGPLHEIRRFERSRLSRLDSVGEDLSTPESQRRSASRAASTTDGSVLDRPPPRCCNASAFLADGCCSSLAARSPDKDLCRPADRVESAHPVLRPADRAGDARRRRSLRGDASPRARPRLRRALRGAARYRRPCRSVPAADVFVTAATSHFETFGRAPPRRWPAALRWSRRATTASRKCSRSPAARSSASTSTIPAHACARTNCCGPSMKC